MAQTETGPAETDTDRPHVGESPVTVGSGRVQLEAGYFITTQKDASAQRTLPVLLRVGTGPDTELRVESDTLTREGAQNGWSDVSLGSKWAFYADEDWELALLGRVFFPSGSSAFKGAGLQPDLKVLVGHELMEGLEFEANLGVASVATNDATRHWQALYTAALTGQVSDKLSLYGEVFGAASSLNFDVGILYRVGPDTQLDLSFFRGLSHGGPGNGLSFGFSQRW